MEFTATFVIFLVFSATQGLMFKCGEEIIVHRGEKKSIQFWSDDDESMRTEVLQRTRTGPLANTHPLSAVPPGKVDRNDDTLKLQIKKNDKPINKEHSAPPDLSPKPSLKNEPGDTLFEENIGGIETSNAKDAENPIGNQELELQIETQDQLKKTEPSYPTNIVDGTPLGDSSTLDSENKNINVNLFSDVESDAKATNNIRKDGPQYTNKDENAPENLPVLYSVELDKITLETPSKEASEILSEDSSHQADKSGTGSSKDDAAKSPESGLTSIRDQPMLINAVDTNVDEPEMKSTSDDNEISPMIDQETNVQTESVQYDLDISKDEPLQLASDVNNNDANNLHNEDVSQDSMKNEIVDSLSKADNDGIIAMDSPDIDVVPTSVNQDVPTGTAVIKAPPKDNIRSDVGQGEDTIIGDELSHTQTQIDIHNPSNDKAHASEVIDKLSVPILDRLVYSDEEILQIINDISEKVNRNEIDEQSLDINLGILQNIINYLNYDPNSQQAEVKSTNPTPEIVNDQLLSSSPEMQSFDPADFSQIPAVIKVTPVESVEPLQLLSDKKPGIQKTPVLKTNEDLGNSQGEFEGAHQESTDLLDSIGDDNLLSKPVTDSKLSIELDAAAALNSAGTDTKNTDEPNPNASKPVIHPQDEPDLMNIAPEIVSDVLTETRKEIDATPDHLINSGNKNDIESDTELDGSQLIEQSDSDIASNIRNEAGTVAIPEPDHSIEPVDNKNRLTAQDSSGLKVEQTETADTAIATKANANQDMKHQDLNSIHENVQIDLQSLDLKPDVHKPDTVDNNIVAATVSKMGIHPHNIGDETPTEVNVKIDMDSKEPLPHSLADDGITTELLTENDLLETELHSDQENLKETEDSISTNLNENVAETLVNQAEINLITNTGESEKDSNIDESSKDIPEDSVLETMKPEETLSDAAPHISPEIVIPNDEVATDLNMNTSHEEIPISILLPLETNQVVKEGNLRTHTGMETINELIYDDATESNPYVAETTFTSLLNMDAVDIFGPPLQTNLFEVRDVIKTLEKTAESILKINKEKEIEEIAQLPTQDSVVKFVNKNTFLPKLPENLILTPTTREEVALQSNGGNSLTGNTEAGLSGTIPAKNHISTESLYTKLNDHEPNEIDVAIEGTKAVITSNQGSQAPVHDNIPSGEISSPTASTKEETKEWGNESTGSVSIDSISMGLNNQDSIPVDESDIITSSPVQEFDVVNGDTVLTPNNREIVNSQGKTDTQLRSDPLPQNEEVGNFHKNNVVSSKVSDLKLPIDDSKPSKIEIVSQSEDTKGVVQTDSDWEALLKVNPEQKTEEQNPPKQIHSINQVQSGLFIDNSAHQLQKTSDDIIKLNADNPLSVEEILYATTTAPIEYDESLAAALRTDTIDNSPEMFEEGVRINADTDALVVEEVKHTLIEPFEIPAEIRIDSVAKDESAVSEKEKISSNLKLGLEIGMDDVLPTTQATIESDIYSPLANLVHSLRNEAELPESDPHIEDPGSEKIDSLPETATEVQLDYQNTMLNNEVPNEQPVNVNANIDPLISNKKASYRIETGGEDESSNKNFVSITHFLLDPTHSFRQALIEKEPVVIKENQSVVVISTPSAISVDSMEIDTDLDENTLEEQQDHPENHVASQDYDNGELLFGSQRAEAHALSSLTEESHNNGDKRTTLNVRNKDDFNQIQEGIESTAEEPPPMDDLYNDPKIRTEAKDEVSANDGLNKDPPPFISDSMRLNTKESDSGNIEPPPMGDLYNDPKIRTEAKDEVSANEGLNKDPPPFMSGTMRLSTKESDSENMMPLNAQENLVEAVEKRVGEVTLDSDNDDSLIKSNRKISTDAFDTSGNFGNKVFSTQHKGNDESPLIIEYPTNDRNYVSYDSANKYNQFNELKKPLPHASETKTSNSNMSGSQRVQKPSRKGSNGGVSLADLIREFIGGTTSGLIQDTPSIPFENIEYPDIPDSVLSRRDNIAQGREPYIQSLNKGSHDTYAKYPNPYDEDSGMFNILHGDKGIEDYLPNPERIGGFPSSTLYNPNIGGISERRQDYHYPYGGDSPFFIKLPGTPNAVPVFLQYEPVEIKYVDSPIQPDGKVNSSPHNVEAVPLADENQNFIGGNQQFNEETVNNKQEFYDQQQFINENVNPISKIEGARPDPFFVMDPPDLSSGDANQNSSPIREILNEDNYEINLDGKLDFGQGNVGNVDTIIGKKDPLLPGDYFIRNPDNSYSAMDTTSLTNPVFSLGSMVSRPNPEVYPQYTPFPLTANPLKNAATKVPPFTQPMTTTRESITRTTEELTPPLTTSTPISTTSTISSTPLATTSPSLSENEVDSESKKASTVYEAPTFEFSPVPSINYGEESYDQFHPSDSRISEVIEETHEQLEGRKPIQQEALKMNLFETRQTTVPKEEDFDIVALANVLHQNQKVWTNDDLTPLPKIGSWRAPTWGNINYATGSESDTFGSKLLTSPWLSSGDEVNSDAFYSAFYSPEEIPGLDPAYFSYRKVSANEEHSRQKRDLSFEDLERFINTLPMPLRQAVLGEGSPSRRRRAVGGDRITCEWNFKGDPGTFLLVTFNDLSAPMTVDCVGAYIEVEKFSNNFAARWCGNAFQMDLRRPHVIFAKSGIRLTVFDNGDPATSVPTGFDGSVEAIDLKDANTRRALMLSNSVPRMRRLLG